MGVIRWVLKIVLPLIVVVVAVMVAKAVIKNGPNPERKQSKPQLPVVEVMVLHPSAYTIQIQTRGGLAPQTQSSLIPELSGRLTQVSSKLRSGGYFQWRDELARIDPRDYELTLTIVRAELAQADLALREEEAKGVQARQDWERIRTDVAPSDLVARRPQYEHAKAALAAAQARVAQAELQLERTRILAPYDGRVLEMKADVGQYVAPGTVLASLYGLSYGEVRLPLTDRQLSRVLLPQQEATSKGRRGGSTVHFRLLDGAQQARWQGQVVRSDGAVESSSRQHHLIAQIANPFRAGDDGRPPLKVGEFLLATIEGETLNDVFVVPREAVQGDDELLLVTQDETLERRKVVVAWRDQDSAIVSEGVKAGERLSLTPVSYATNGRKVKIYTPDEAQSTAPKGASGSVQAVGHE